MKVYLTSGELGPGAWNQQETLLRDLWRKSSRRHELAEDPAEADLILVGDLRLENQARSLRAHPVIRRFPDRCYGFNEDDVPPRLPWLPGVYANQHRGMWFPSRYRTGTFGLHHLDFRNPKVWQHPGQAWTLPKRYLASFHGRDCHPVRHTVLNLKWRRSDVSIVNTSQFNTFRHSSWGKEPAWQSYLDCLLASRFALCPRGSGASIIRLFESMHLGVAPVILSDNYVLPRGPRWEEFALIVPETEAGNLEAILEREEPTALERGRLAAQTYREFFAEDRYFDYLIDQILSIRTESRFPQTLWWRSRHLVALVQRLHHAVHRRLFPKRYNPTRR